MYFLYERGLLLDVQRIKKEQDKILQKPLSTFVFAYLNRSTAEGDYCVAGEKDEEKTFRKTRRSLHYFQKQRNLIKLQDLLLLAGLSKCKVQCWMVHLEDSCDDRNMNLFLKSIGEKYKQQELNGVTYRCIQEETADKSEACLEVHDGMCVCLPAAELLMVRESDKWEKRVSRLNDFLETLAIRTPPISFFYTNDLLGKILW